MTIATALLTLSLATPAQAILSGSCPVGTGPSGPVSQVFDLFDAASPLYDPAIALSQSNAEAARLASEAALAAFKATGSNATSTLTQVAYAAWQAALIAEAVVLDTECGIMIALMTAVVAETGGTCLVEFEHTAFRTPEVLYTADKSLLRAISQFLAHTQTCITLGDVFPQLLSGVSGGAVRDATLRADVSLIQTDAAALFEAIKHSISS